MESNKNRVIKRVQAGNVSYSLRLRFGEFSLWQEEMPGENGCAGREECLTRGTLFDCVQRFDEIMHK